LNVIDVGCLVTSHADVSSMNTRGDIQDQTTGSLVERFLRRGEDIVRVGCLSDSRSEACLWLPSVSDCLGLGRL